MPAVGQAGNGRRSCAHCHSHSSWTGRRPGAPSARYPLPTRPNPGSERGRARPAQDGRRRTGRGGGGPGSRAAADGRRPIGAHPVPAQPGPRLRLHGCAWPDPDPDQRSVTEFCENGAKAVAEEARGGDRPAGHSGFLRPAQHHRAAPPPTTPRSTSWSRWTRPLPGATAPARSPSSCGWSRPARPIPLRAPAPVRIQAGRGGRPPQEPGGAVPPELIAAGSGRCGASRRRRDPRGCCHSRVDHGLIGLL